MLLQQKIIFISFILSVIVGFFLIPILRKLKIGQMVREDGPKTHLSKLGTPTIGGGIFLIPFVIICGALGIKNPKLLPILLVTIGFGLIGFIDDFKKIKAKNSKGISPKQKMIGLLLIATGYSVYLYNSSNIITEIIIPFTTKTIDIGIWFIPFSILVLLATTNSVNLTDGLDGLVGGMGTIIMVFYCIISIAIENTELGIISSCMIGALLGFLVFNMKPAKVFMGDTGSLALGGLIGAIAITLRLPLILFFIAIIPVAEAISDIIQVVSYKLTKKRVFKMAPLHHHFELSGWSEMKVVWVFWIITLIACIIAIIGLKLTII